MTRDRMSPTTRDPKMPAATDSADLPVLCPLPSDLSPAPSALVKVVVWRRLAERAARLLHEKGLDEDVDVAVQHAVYIADLLLRAVVFDHLIRMHYIAADLAAERDVAFYT